VLKVIDAYDCDVTDMNLYVNLIFCSGVIILCEGDI